MPQVQSFAPGSYRFQPSVFQYSAGVCAMPGHTIIRETFATPKPVKQGFALIAERLKVQGLPLTSFCACELRSPGQFDDAGFRAFNEEYILTLNQWGIMDATRVNPVARSNVCPEVNAPPEPSFHAFSYVFPAADEAPASCVISGSAEARPPKSDDELYRDRIVRFGETVPDAIAEKVAHVVGVMEQRLAGFDLGWCDTTAVQAYSVHDFHHAMGDMANKFAAARGLTWHFARPPVQGLEYEMDCRAVHAELTHT
jgi:hypothetical protein